MGRLDGKMALVTGGASGLGLAIAARLTAEGAAVVISDRQRELGEQTAAGLGATFLSQDVTNEDQWPLTLQRVGGAGRAGQHPGQQRRDRRRRRPGQPGGHQVRRLEADLRGQPRQRLPRLPGRDRGDAAHRRRLDRQHVLHRRAAGHARLHRVRRDQGGRPAADQVRRAALRDRTPGDPVQLGAPGRGLHAALGPLHRADGRGHGRAGRPARAGGKGQGAARRHAGAGGHRRRAWRSCAQTTPGSSPAPS